MVFNDWKSRGKNDHYWQTMQLFILEKNRFSTDRREVVVSSLKAFHMKSADNKIMTRNKPKIHENIQKS